MCFMNLYEYTLMIFDMLMADMVVILSVLLSIYFSRVSMYSRLCVCEKGVKKKLMYTNFTQITINFYRLLDIRGGLGKRNGVHVLAI